MSEFINTKLQKLRRRIILEYLATRQDGEASADILVSVINSTRDGVTAFYSEVVEDVHWLKEKGFATVFGEDVVVAKITPPGERIVEGTERDPGIALRRPGT